MPNWQRRSRAYFWEMKIIERTARGVGGGVRLATCCLVAGMSSLQAQTPVLNELMASNSLAVFDDFFESDDWVEIYNPGGLVQMAGYHISDDPTNLTKYTFPDTDPGSTFLTPGGHMLVWCDKDSVQGVLHANFKLSPENEGVWLTAPDGVTVLDSIVYPPQQTDISYGRACDGCEEWVYFNVPTPEDSNADQILDTPTLYLNEVLLDNTVNLVDEFFEADAWIEVFNPNPQQVNLGGYTLASSSGDSWTLPLNDPVSTTVAGDGFLLLWLDGQPEQGGHHASFSAAAQAQTFTLVGPDLIVADEFEAEVSFSNVSWGRSTDGAASLTWFDVPTPRVTNSLLVVPPDDVVLNEFQSYNVTGVVDNVSETEDWVEIHNRSSVPVNLAGYYLTDRLNNPTKWRFPIDVGDSTVIEPNGYLVLWADEDLNQGWNHTNFRINNAGEALVLRSPDGFTIADSVHFGASLPDVSKARLPNGTGMFEWTENITPNACNDCPSSVNRLPLVPGSEFFFGPNPVRTGQTFVLTEGAELWDLAGRFVARWDAGTHLFPQSSPGLHVLKSSGGESRAWVVAQ
jgi:hypothetical protein